MKNITIVFALVGWFFVATRPGIADDRLDIEYFEQNVRSVLIDHCIKCHGADQQEGGLRLDQGAAILSGGDSGAAVIAGNPDQSLVWQRVVAGEMPPRTEPVLPSRSQKAIRRWIELGAGVSDQHIDPKEAKDWRRLWSLNPPNRQMALESLPESFRNRLAVDVASISVASPMSPDASEIAPFLQAWYRAADLETLNIGDEEEVPRWPDRSGHGRDLVPTRLKHPNGLGSAGTFRRKSKISSQPAVRFHAQTGYGSPGDNPVPILGDAGFTLSIVMNLSPRHGGYPHDLIVSFGEFGAAQNPGKALAGGLGIQRIPGSDHLLSVVGGWGHDALLPTGSFAPLYHQNCVVTLVKTPGPISSTTKVFINGASCDSLFGNSSIRGGEAIPDFQERVARDFSVMLGNAANGAGPFLGDVAELVIYSQPLSDEQRSGVESELSNRYQIHSLKDRVDLTIGDSAKCHPIDAFIDSKLHENGIEPAPQADRRVLIRRAYFDLIGLPPTPEQIDKFVNNPSPLAWESLLIELLASPHYGERWGRHWLDVARYADSAGFETEEYHRNAWRYRDWVIKALNEDVPYDRFVSEQIAGDELWPSTMVGNGAYALSQKQIAQTEGHFGTGFFGLGPRIGESRADAKLLRYEDATDWVDTLGAAFLGMTVGCARCHDHKFDPISQRDYFGLQAVFQHSHLMDKSVLIGVEHSNWNTDYPSVLRVAAARDAYRLFEQSIAGRAATAEEQSRVNQLKLDIAQAVLAVPTGTSVGGPFAKQYDGIFEIPTVTVLGHHEPVHSLAVHRLERGDLDQPREQIDPALPHALSQATGLPDSIEDGFLNRAQLAQWLTHPDHPLTARVMVNRIWQGHFGRGIVSTPNDFGRMGQPPTHPELLDYLATEFVARGWSMKAMHQWIMTSRAYQRGQFDADDSRLPNVRLIDPNNQGLSYFPRRRLEGEAIWDSLHAVAGTLNLQLGGPAFAPPLAPEEYSGMKFTQQWVVSADPKQHTRRGVYMLALRVYRFPLFDVFDAPNNGVSVGSRDVSTVAPQALWLLNNQRIWTQSHSLAARVVRDTGTASDSMVRKLFRIAIGRLPNSDELESSVKLLEEWQYQPTSSGSTPLPPELASLPAEKSQALVALCVSLISHNEFLYID